MQEHHYYKSKFYNIVINNGVNYMKTHEMIWLCHNLYFVCGQGNRLKEKTECTDTSYQGKSTPEKLRGIKLASRFMLSGALK